MLRQWCSLSMLHRTCENMLGGVWLGGLSMPNGWCTMCMPIYVKPWDIKKYSVPYMVQIELNYIPNKCGIVNPAIGGSKTCQALLELKPEVLVSQKT